MDVRTGSFLWQPQIALATQALPPTLNTEIVIVGAGITGALLAERLVGEGYEVAVVDRYPPASGSTTASTAIIQYDLDENLSDLESILGIEAARSIYLKCCTDVHDFKEFVLGLGDGVAMEVCPNLYLARDKDERLVLEKEFLARRAAGLQVEWLSDADIASRYPWPGEAGIYHNDCFCADPVQLTLSIWKLLEGKGVSLLVDAFLLRVESNGDGIELIFTGGQRARCKKMIFAAGYETPKLLPERLGKLTSSYAGATAARAQVPKWADRAAVWEVARPYHYWRRTPDDRVILGGRDKPFHNSLMRDALIPLEKRQLEKTLYTISGGTLTALENCWAGTFAESPDGLPFIGPHPEFSDVFVVYGCGGNGIIFSFMGRELMSAWLERREHELAGHFALQRDGNRSQQ